MLRARDDARSPRETRGNEEQSEHHAGETQRGAEQPADGVAPYGDTQEQTERREQGEHARRRSRCGEVRFELTAYLLSSTVLRDQSIEGVGQTGALGRGDTPAGGSGCEEGLGRPSSIVTQGVGDIASPPSRREGARSDRAVALSEGACQGSLRGLARTDVSDNLGQGFAQLPAHARPLTS